jgi:hypothetical protein
MTGEVGLICPDCGHRNVPGAVFCASCKVFLDWERHAAGGASVGSGSETAPGTVEPGTAVPAPEVSEAAEVAIGPEPSTPSAGESAGPEPEPAHRPTVPAEPEPEPARPEPARPAEPRTEDPAAVRPRTPTGFPGTVRRPGEQPTDPADNDPPPTTDDDGPGTGSGTTALPRTVLHDLVCPNCSEPNPRTRTLCVRCGAVLAARQADAERLSWWERLLRRIFRRTPRRLAAGERPPGRAWRRPSLAVPLTLILLLGGGYLGRPYLHSATGYLRDRTAKPTPVNPKFAGASSQLKAHPPSDAFDGSNNRYWAPAETGAGKGQYLEARFEQPVRLQKVIIHSGVSANKDDFIKQARPSVLDVELSGLNGQVEKKELKLEDVPGPQTLDLAGSKIRAVRFIIRSSYGTGGKNRHTAIAEVEFFGRR